MNTPVNPVRPATPSTPTRPTTPLAKPSVSPSSSAPKTIKPPPFRMEKADPNTGRWLNMMVYGKAGAGKTTLAGSSADVPDMQEVLYVDCEKGRLAIEDNDRIKHPEFIADNRIEVEDFTTIAHVHDFLVAHCKYRDENNVDKLKEVEAWLRGCDPSEIDEPKRFRTVMLDSLTEVDTYCQYNVLGLDQASLLKEATSVDEMDVAGWPQFRKINQMMQMTMRSFRDLPIHFIATCGRTWSEDELKKRYYAPSLTGQLRLQIPSFFDIVGYLDSVTATDGTEERRMYVKPVGKFEAKNRRPIFKSDFFKNPTMTDIMKGVGLLR